MNNKKIILVLLTLLALALGACSGSSAGTETTSTTESTQSTVSTPEDMGDTVEMNEVSQLAFGTLYLDDTDLPVTAEQAQIMLPLWQLYQTMASEDTTASEELDAIVQQILSAFTEEQLAALDEMDLSNPMTLMSDFGAGNFSATTEDGEAIERPENFSGAPEGFESGGGVPSIGGAFEGGGGMGQGMGAGMGAGTGINDNADPEAIATAQADRQTGFGEQQALRFIPAVISYLEGIIVE